MRLTDIASHALNGVATRVRRDAIGYAICAICGIAVVVLIAGASVLALEPQVGMVCARLIVAGVFVLLMVATLVWLQRAQSRHRPAATPPLGLRADAAAQRQVQFAQIAMIVEAVMLGYSLSRRTNRR